MKEKSLAGECRGRFPRGHSLPACTYSVPRMDGFYAENYMEII